MSDHFQIAVIGSGPGGYVAALKAAQLGASVAVIEKHHLGGTCLNYGCIPSKALLSSAELLHQLQHSGDWGVSVSNVAFDWAKIQGRKDKVLAANRSGIASLFKGRKVTLFQGLAKLAAQGTFGGIGWIGGPHQIPPFFYGSFGLQHHDDTGSAGHEISELTKKRPLFMDIIEPFRLTFTKVEFFHTDNLKSFGVDPRNNFTSGSCGKGVGLDNGKCSFHG